MVEECLELHFRELARAVDWKAERIIVQKELIWGCRDIAFSSTLDVDEMTCGICNTNGNAYAATLPRF